MQSQQNKSKIQSIRDCKMDINNKYDYLNFLRKNHDTTPLTFDNNNAQKKNLLLRLPNPGRNTNQIPSCTTDSDKDIRAPIQALKFQPKNVFNYHKIPNYHDQFLRQINSRKLYEPINENKGLYKRLEIEDQKYLTYDMLMEVMHAKNREIAQSLLKQRQSISEIIYVGPTYKPRSLERLPNRKPQSDKKALVPKALPGSLLKFPELPLKKGHHAVTTASQSKIYMKKSIRDKLNQLAIEKNQKSIKQDSAYAIQAYKYKDSVSVKQVKNNQVLKAYYQNKSTLHFKEQSYKIIPQFQAPQKKVKEIEKHKKAKQKNNRFTLNLQANCRQSEMGSITEGQSLGYIKIKVFRQPQLRQLRKLPTDGSKEITSEDPRELRIMGQDAIAQTQETLQCKKQIGNEYIKNLNKSCSESSKFVGEQMALQDTFKEETTNLVESPTRSSPKKSSLLYKSKSKTNFLVTQKQKDSSIYQGKIRSYRQYLFQMNLVHRKFDPLTLTQEPSANRVDTKYKFYVGKGNNSFLIKSIMKRRFWWSIQQDPQKSNFVWTQLKMNNFYQLQTKGCLRDPYDKLENCQQQTKNKQTKMKALKKKDSLLSPIKPNKLGNFKAPMVTGLAKIMTKVDQDIYNSFMQNADYNKISKFENRLKYFPTNLLSTNQTDKSELRMHNHFQFNYYIGNKKALFYNLRRYYQLTGKNLGEAIPLTFHIKKGTKDPQYQSFLKEFRRIKLNRSQIEQSSKNDGGCTTSKNVWIIKPGEVSNRGMGITVIDQIYELNNILKRKQKHSNGSEKTYIVQKYIQNPMLYNRRKFDIRHYMVLTRLYGRMRAYWYSQGYIRTSCYQYNLQQIENQYMHLTNDAIQKSADCYGKYQQANKLSYNQFQRHLDSTYPDKKYSLADQIYPRMKQIALDAVKATCMNMDPSRYQSNFQIFGLDFMIDDNFNVYLIEVNTNPCLEINCNLLNRVIPTMLEHCFRLSLDVIFPPPHHYPNSMKYICPDNPLERLQYQLIFDQARDGKQLQELYKNAKQVERENIQSEDQTYDNDGKEIDLDEDID